MCRRFVRASVAAMGCATACVGLASPAGAVVDDIDGIFVEERIFNDFPGTNLVTVNNYPTELSFTEDNFIPDGVPDFANRHAGYFSSDSGTSPRGFSNDEGFIFSVDVTLTATETSPRKEVGIYIETLIAGQAQFIITSDNGEVAAFGAGAPFVSSTNDAAPPDGLEFNGMTYTPGDTVNLKLVYIPPNANKAEGSAVYLYEGVSAGERDFSNLENGIIDGSQIGMYAQFPPNILAADSGSAVFENIFMVPLIPGDFDLDGNVDLDDYDILSGNYGTAADATIEDGDADRNGTVDFEDFVRLALNFGEGTEQAETIAALPEPGTIGLVLMCGALCVRRHRSVL